LGEFYADNLGEEVTRGMRESASRGFYLSSKPPYGYRKVKVGDGDKGCTKKEGFCHVEKISRSSWHISWQYSCWHCFFIVATLVGVGIHYLTGWPPSPGVTFRELLGVRPCGAEGGMLGLMITPYPIGVIMGIILFGKLSHH